MKFIKTKKKSIMHHLKQVKIIFIYLFQLTTFFNYNSQDIFREKNFSSKRRKYNWFF